MNKISQRTKGIVCILFAAFGFSMMTVFVRLAGDVPTAEKAFFRNFVALLLVSVLLAVKRVPLKPRPGDWPLLAGPCRFRHHRHAAEFLRRGPSGAGGCQYAQ